MLDVIGRSEKYVGEYRAAVAPFRKNTWNKLSDFLFESKAGWAIAITLIVLFCGAILFSGKPFMPVWIGLVIVFLFFLYAQFKEIFGGLMAKPATWQVVPLPEFLDQWPAHPALSEIRSAIESMRSVNPAVEFTVEYLYDKHEAAEGLPPTTLVLWSWDDPFGKTKKWARLLLNHGVPYVDPKEQVSYPAQ